MEQMKAMRAATAPQADFRGDPPAGGVTTRGIPTQWLQPATWQGRRPKVPLPSGGIPVREIPSEEALRSGENPPE